MKPGLMAGAIVAAAVAASPVVRAQQPGTLQPLPVTRIDGPATRQQPAVQPGPILTQGDAPAQLPPAPVVQLGQSTRDSRLDAVRFSLTFSEPRPVVEIMRLFFGPGGPAEGLSFVPAPGLEQTFEGELNNVTVREALDLMTETTNLDYSVRGNVVRLFPRQLETRLYSVDYVITSRTGNRGTSASSAAAGVGAGGLGLGGGPGGGVGGGVGAGATGGGTMTGGGGSSASVGGTDNPDVFGDLATGIGTLLSPQGRFNIDRTAALLSVTDIPSRLDLVEQYLETVMTRVTRQVQIEARVLEVEMRDEFAAGINWSLLLNNVSSVVSIAQDVTPTSGGGITFGLQIKDFDAFLNAFATQGSVNVLSSPRVTAMNNTPALMRIGTQDVFFTTTTQVGETGQLLQASVVPQAITEGIVLSVTAQIAADGIIHMSISPSITERTGTATSRLGDTVPVMSVREADTLVRVREGETVVIAGLMQDRMTTAASKVPLLGDLPVIGGAFRRTETTRRKTDLVILLTPRLMSPAQIPGTTARELRRLDSAQGAVDGR